MAIANPTIPGLARVDTSFTNPNTITLAELTESFRALVENNRCDCGLLYEVFRCTWIGSPYNFAVGCPICHELVAEACTLDELELDFAEHLENQDDVPF